MNGFIIGAVFMAKLIYSYAVYIVSYISNMQECACISHGVKINIKVMKERSPGFALCAVLSG